MSKLRPNFTQIPNVVLDEWMPELNKGELKVLLYVMRRTYGFQKESDNISLSQICGGIEGKDLGTGLSVQTVITAIASLEGKGIIRVIREGVINRYEISLSGDATPKIRVLQKLDQPTLKIRGKVLKKLETQKKEKKRLQKKEGNGNSKEIVSVINEFQKFNPSARSFYGNTTQRKAAAELVELYGIEPVLKVISVLPQTNRMEYVPVVTTPAQLSAKWTQLAASIQKIKNKQPIIL